MRVVIERAASSPGLSSLALAVARALRSFWFGAGPTRDVATLLPPLLAVATERSADRAAVLWALGLYRARYARVETCRAPLEAT